VDETLVCDHSNDWDEKQYFHVVLFIMLYKVVLTFKLVCDQTKAIGQFFKFFDVVLLFSESSNFNWHLLRKI